MENPEEDVYPPKLGKKEKKTPAPPPEKQESLKPED